MKARSARLPDREAITLNTPLHLETAAALLAELPTCLSPEEHVRALRSAAIRCGNASRRMRRLQDKANAIEAAMELVREADHAT